MTVIRPNSISGVTSITAMANEINVFKHDGVLAGLQLNGVNHHTSSGVSTFHTLNVLGNVSVGGTLTYEDVTNIDSVGIITAQSGIHLDDSISHIGDTNTKIRFPAADTFTVETAGDEALRIDSSGRLLLNTTTTYVSNQMMIVKGASPSAGGNRPYDGQLAIEGSETTGAINTGGVLAFIGHDGANSRGFGSIRNLKEDGTSGNYGTYMSFETRVNGSAPTEKVRITSAGKVGIGTDNPSQTLHILSDGNALIRLESTDAYAGVQFVDPDTGAKPPLIYGAGDDFTIWTDWIERFRVKLDGKIGIGLTNPENELHIAGTTGSSAGGLLRLDATTGDNFIIFDNTADNSEWVIGNDSGNNDQFRLYYNGGSGYGDPIINVDGTPSNGKVTIDGGTSTLVTVRANSSGTAGLRCGGNSGSGSDQCTGYVEVHQDESHGGGFFYNGDASPSFASSNEAADYFSIHRLSAGQRHVVQRWFHSSNDCEMFGNLLIDNGNTTTLTVRGNSSGTAGVRAGGSSGSGSNQCTGYLEVHQDEAHGGGISYNGDGSPGFVNNETADNITFYRMNNGTRERVFSYPYNSNAVSFRGGASFSGSVSKAGGSFRISHPHPSKKNTHDLVHSFIEGPQCDNIYRGKIDLVGGSATVNLDTVSKMTDGTFVLLNRDIQCFTTNETGWTAVKGSVSGNVLTITAQENSCTDTISWMIIGERQDDTIKSLDMTDDNADLIVEPLKGS